jgi:hypothetical protein
MTRQISIFVAVLSLALVLSYARETQDQSQQSGAAHSDQAIIADSGSTNTAGYQVTVHPSGSAEWSVSRRRNSPACPGQTGKLSAELTQRFFADLRSLMPLDRVPVGHCAKSVSFGTTLHVTYQGATSPDLTCPGNGAQTDNLLKDLSDINKALGINTGVTGASHACEQQPATPNP